MQNYKGGHRGIHTDLGERTLSDNQEQSPAFFPQNENNYGVELSAIPALNFVFLFFGYSADGRQANFLTVFKALCCRASFYNSLWP